MYVYSFAYSRLVVMLCTALSSLLSRQIDVSIIEKQQGKGPSELTAYYIPNVLQPLPASDTRRHMITNEHDHTTMKQ